jgi:signal transduction histidine kinase
MVSLKDTLRSTFTLGVRPEQEFSEKRDIIFTNQALSVLVFSTICIGMVELLSGFGTRSSIAFTTTALLSIAFFAQHTGRYQLAKWIAVIWPMIASALSVPLFGILANTHLYLIATLTLGLVIFHSAKQHLLLLAVHVPLFLSVLYISKNNVPIFAGQDSVSLGHFHAVFIFLNIFVMLREFAEHNLRYDARINQLISSAQAQTAMLQEQKAQIEQQAADLQRSNHFLQNEIKEKETAQRLLMASNEELEQFAYVASHDLKEPLRTVGSFIQLIFKRHQDHFDETSQEYYGFVVDGVKRMSALLDDLLALSRLKKGSEMAEVDLNTVLESVCFNLRGQIEKSEGEILVSSLPVILASKLQLVQLFQNLLSNSLKFKGGAPAQVVIGHAEQPDAHLFWVKDNGIGVPEEYLEKVFVIFQRLHKRSMYEGTGIGLAICKKVVQNHGGSIWIESKEGKGTSVFFTISKHLGTGPALSPEMSAHSLLN